MFLLQYGVVVWLCQLIGIGRMHPLRNIYSSYWHAREMPECQQVIRIDAGTTPWQCRKDVPLAFVGLSIMTNLAEGGGDV